MTAGRAANISEYCQCLPKCHRTEYKVTQSQARLSEHATRVLSLTTTIQENMDELASIQNWTSVAATRKDMAVLLAAIDVNMYKLHVSLYNSIQELQIMLAQNIIKYVAYEQYFYDTFT